MWKSLHEMGRWEGEIWNRRKNGEIYPEWLALTCVRDKRGEVLNYIATFSDITARKAATERVEHMAHFDQLTGLPNRSLLKDRLEQALASARRYQLRVAFFFLDLDGFKAINDSLGHAAGDQLLIEVGRRLKGLVREEDTVARFGGDEFVMVIAGNATEQAVETVAMKAVAGLARPFAVVGCSAEIGASIGIALFPDVGLDCNTLLLRADEAMYQAKQTGRGTYCYWSAPNS